LGIKCFLRRGTPPRRGVRHFLVAKVRRLGWSIIGSWTRHRMAATKKIRKAEWTRGGVKRPAVASGRMPPGWGIRPARIFRTWVHGLTTCFVSRRFMEPARMLNWGTRLLHRSQARAAPLAPQTPYTRFTHCLMEGRIHGHAFDVRVDAWWVAPMVAKIDKYSPRKCVFVC
jgi:hypothetical protein